MFSIHLSFFICKVGVMVIGPPEHVADVLGQSCILILSPEPGVRRCGLWSPRNWRFLS